MFWLLKKAVGLRYPNRQGVSLMGLGAHGSALAWDRGSPECLNDTPRERLECGEPGLARSVIIMGSLYG